MVRDLLSLEIQQPLAWRGCEGIFGCLEMPAVGNSCLPKVLCEDQGDPQQEGAKKINTGSWGFLVLCKGKSQFWGLGRNLGG